jgi:putative IMPACT (imprinted ancient) family translation regulator
VRYFGGTLLGVPGLINAYKMASSLALQLTPIVEKQVHQKYLLEFDYTIMNEVMVVIKKFGCAIIENETLLFCRMKIGVPRESEAACIEKLTNLNELTLRQVKP